MQYKKKYESKIEDKFRMKVFAENKKYIAKHNQRFEQGLVSFRVGVNKFCDMTHDEINRTMNEFINTIKDNKELQSLQSVKGQVDSKGAVTKVKDQSRNRILLGILRTE